MSRRVLTSFDFNGNEIQNYVVQNLGTAPSSPTPGREYYDTTAQIVLTWNGAAWIDQRARANHTGLQLAATISDLAATVQAYPLSAFAAPTTPLSAGGLRINNIASPFAAGQAATYDWTLGLALSSFTGTVTANLAMAGYTLTGLATPTAAGQAATYDFVMTQVQSAAAGISSKDPVAYVAIANITRSGTSQVIDGSTSLPVGTRVLCVGQTTAASNGVWVVQSGTWTRPTTEGATFELDPGATWLVTNGSTYAGTQWRMSTTGTITPGTTAISIVQFGAGNSYTAGNGISLVGSAFSALANPAAGSGISITSAGIAIDPSVVPRKFAATIGDGSTTAIVVTHSLGTQDVLMQVKRSSTPFDVIECDMAATSTTTSTFTFASAPASNALRVTVIG